MFAKLEERKNLITIVLVVVVEGTIVQIPSVINRILGRTPPVTAQSRDFVM
jgi:hypothetical protein